MYGSAVGLNVILDGTLSDPSKWLNRLRTGIREFLQHLEPLGQVTTRWAHFLSCKTISFLGAENSQFGCWHSKVIPMNSINCSTAKFRTFLSSNGPLQVGHCLMLSFFEHLFQSRCPFWHWMILSGETWRQTTHCKISCSLLLSCAEADGVCSSPWIVISASGDFVFDMLMGTILHLGF